MILQDLNCILSQSDGVMTSTVRDDDEVLFQIHTDQLYVITGVASVIWSILEKPTPIVQILEQLYITFPDVPKDQVKADCLEFLQQLLDGNLIKPVVS